MQPPLEPPALPLEPLPPINIHKWAQDNESLLKPPVNNYCVFKSSNYTVMVVGGPNKRSDYHVNPTDELFYQVKGSMLLRIVTSASASASDGVSGTTTTGGKMLVFKDVEIGQGEIFMLPGGIPHNPVRFADTVGLVVEVPRPEGMLGGSLWSVPSTDR